MDRLSIATLPKLTYDVKDKAVEVPTYQATSITSGIVHFGTGNFHRAHQAVYCDALLNEGELNWGIIGISLRSAGMRDNLAPQDYLYTQATLGESTTLRVIGSIQNLLVAPENSQAVIDVVAHNNCQLVTTTITEKGYYLANGEINLNDADIRQDIASIKQPKTTYGYIAAALIKRHHEQGTSLTVLCCDNIQAGGEHLRHGVNMLLAIHSPETLTWVADNVAFSSSMVDRVTPATNDQLKTEIAKQLGLEDFAPVAAEPFTQWIIEDNFAGKRPPFDKVGAVFVKDIAPFEHIKLRFLNAGHSMLAALGYLSGDSFVHEALQRPVLAQFTEQALNNNVLPVTSIPEGVSGIAYIDQVLERFRNSNLPYAVLQVGTDSSQKIQQRWLPSIDDALHQNKDCSYLAFSLAAWVCFILKALKNDVLNDPLRDDFASKRILNSESSKNHVTEFLSLAGADRFNFFSNDAFMSTVISYYHAIGEVGVEQALVTTKIITTES